MRKFVQKKRQELAKKTPSTVWAFYARGRFFYLLLTLVLLLLLYPLAGEGVWGRVVLGLFHTTILLAGVYAVSREDRHVRIVAVLGAPMLVATWLNVWFSSQIMLVVMELLLAPFYIYVTVRLLDYVMHGKRLTADTLYGAICGYLLLGICWSLVYSVLNVFRVDSFVVSLPVEHHNGVLKWPDFLYYSFSTLTSLGFGDMVPVKALARSLTILEVTTGMLYLTMVVSRIVGLHQEWPKNK